MTGLRLSDLLEPVMQLAYEAGLLLSQSLIDQTAQGAVALRQTSMLKSRYFCDSD